MKDYTCNMILSNKKIFEVFVTVFFKVLTHHQNKYVYPQTPSSSYAKRIFYLIRLEALSLHAVFPEGQHAVLKANCHKNREETSIQ